MKITLHKVNSIVSLISLVLSAIISVKASKDVSK